MEKYENKSSDLPYLKVARGNVRGRLTRFATLVEGMRVKDTLTDHDRTQISTRLDDARGILEEFGVVQQFIEVCDESEVDEAVWADFEKRYYDAVSDAKLLIAPAKSEKNARQPSQVPTHVEAVVTAVGNGVLEENEDNIAVVGQEMVVCDQPVLPDMPSSEVAAPETPSVTLDRSVRAQAATHTSYRLPPIQMPGFDGTRGKWLEFKDVFTALVRRRSDYSDTEKFCYLRSCLRDEALNHVASLDTTDENFALAWNMLCERFDDAINLKTGYINAILHYPRMSTESAVQMRKLNDEMKRLLQALRTVGHDVPPQDAVIFHMIVDKFDPQTHREWERDGPSDPAIADLLSFLQKQAGMLERLEQRLTEQGKMVPVPVPVNQERSPRVAVLKPLIPKAATNRNVCTTVTERSVGKNNVSTCVFCRKAHGAAECPEFLAEDFPGRWNMVRMAHACLICLKKGHMAAECYSKGRCKLCGQGHHVLMHKEVSKVSTTAVCGNMQVCHGVMKGSVVSVLPTVVVHVLSSSGKYVQVRALLDSGSQSHIISKACAQMLKVRTKPVDLSIVGVGGHTTRSAKATTITICAMNSAYRCEVSCLVFDSVTNQMPSVALDRDALQIPVSASLADKSFDVPGSVDLLIGIDVLWDCLLPEVIALGATGAVLRNSRFGWVVAGRMLTRCPNLSGSVSSLHAVVHQGDPELERFWKQEEVLDATPVLTEEQSACEKLFAETTVRDINGRFVVRLPRREMNDTKWNNSREIAERRFSVLECRLKRNENLRKDYVAFMTEYEHMGHMSAVQHEKNDTERFFLPHHHVLKEESSTTKMRVVFDASCTLSNGCSLNDMLFRGPALQDDVLTLLLRFRMHRFVITADVAKMYRQVLVDPADRRFQCIYWRSSPEKPLVIYELNTVTYGTKPASFLATKCLQVCADAVADERVKRIILQDFYMDDMITGCDDVDTLRRTSRCVADVLQQHKFPLRKWRSNVTELSDGSTSEYLQIVQSETAKTLGLVWRASSIEFLHSCAVASASVDELTKRKALSIISRVFDPLGLLAPVVILAKRYMQGLWVLDCGWDDALPVSLCGEFLELLEQFVVLKGARVSRLVSPGVNSTLHVFTDASEHAYCATVYIRSEPVDGSCACLSNRVCDGRAHVRLMCSKTRLAPLKSLTMPRLELCGAVLGVELARAVCRALGRSVSDCTFYTDSTIVLAWLKSMPHTLKTFVSHRVARIQGVTAVTQWHHVSGIENPADLGARGIPGADLNGSSLWWFGPHWLRCCERLWPLAQVEIPEIVPELRSLVCTTSVDCIIDFDQFSSFVKLVNSVAYVLRFAQNAKCAKIERCFGPLRVDELRSARRLVFLLVQKQSYARELEQLKGEKVVNGKSEVRQLSPFVCSDGLLRIKGRLGNSAVPYDEKHPVVLPSKHCVTRLFLEKLHQLTLHGGPQQMVAEARRQVWIPRIREIARRVCWKCVRCFRTKPKNEAPLMGHLPADRTVSCPPFSKVGVDYAGPLMLRSSHIRNAKQYKAWVCIFVCMVTRAIHIELVTELSTAAFLSCFRRFTARRGVPFRVFSDNGTNFVGAAKELRKLFTGMSADNIVGTIARQGCEWRFNPPGAPHFGGLWEAGVKSVKYHLNRVLKTWSMTYEEVNTVLVEIECILNARPLCSLTDDPSDCTPLTPSHFLIGRPMFAVPAECNEKSYVRVRFRRTQEHVRQFWQQWRTLYLRELQRRPKWCSDSRVEVRVGDLVTVLNDALPPAQWQMARVYEVYPGRDEIVRVASVRFANGSVMKRPIVKLF